MPEVNIGGDGQKPLDEHRLLSREMAGDGDVWPGSHIRSHKRARELRDKNRGLEKNPEKWTVMGGSKWERD